MAHRYDVLATETVFDGRVVSVRKDTVAMPGDTTSQRDVVEHPGAVGVVALDAAGRVLFVQQYRHPVRRRLDELPAGLLDVDGEPSLQAAQRELMEEAGLAADSWHVLVDALTSPGMTDEAIRLYLARDVREVDRDVQEHEEAEMTTPWQPLETAVRRVLGGEVENAMACLGVLAADRAARDGFRGLRPADAPWSSRKRGGHRGTRLDAATVRPYADAHGAAVVAGDTAHVLADIDPALHPHLGPVLQAMPQPVTGAEVASLNASGDDVVALIRYEGADGSATVRSVWRVVGDRPLIVEVAPS